jgi:hypothetical protein
MTGREAFIDYCTQNNLLQSEEFNTWQAACAWQREQDAKLMDAMAAQDKRSNYYQVAARAIREPEK